MRNLARNKREIAWVNYKGKENYLDSNGKKTGEKKVSYYPLKKLKVHVSGAKGSASIEVFGTEINYDKSVLMTRSEFSKTGLDKKDHITENSVFFIDVKPAFDESGTPLYDYRVKKIGGTINEVVIALEKVSKNG